MMMMMMMVMMMTMTTTTTTKKFERMWKEITLPKLKFCSGTYLQGFRNDIENLRTIYIPA
jgi:hypothetical protein